MTTNDLADLAERLSSSVAINAIKQSISLIDVRIEASMREMEEYKRILEKLEKVTKQGV